MGTRHSKPCLTRRRRRHRRPSRIATFRNILPPRGRANTLISDDTDVSFLYDAHAKERVNPECKSMHSVSSCAQKPTLAPLSTCAPEPEPTCAPEPEPTCAPEPEPTCTPASQQTIRSPIKFSLPTQPLVEHKLKRHKRYYISSSSSDEDCCCPRCELKREYARKMASLSKSKHQSAEFSLSPRQGYEMPVDNSNRPYTSVPRGPPPPFNPHICPVFPGIYGCTYASPLYDPGFQGCQFLAGCSGPPPFSGGPPPFPCAPPPVPNARRPFSREKGFHSNRQCSYFNAQPYENEVPPFAYQQPYSYTQPFPPSCQYAQPPMPCAPPPKSPKPCPARVPLCSADRYHRSSERRKISSACLCKPIRPPRYKYVCACKENELEICSKPCCPSRKERSSCCSESHRRSSHLKNESSTKVNSVYEEIADASSASGDPSRSKADHGHDCNVSSRNSYPSRVYRGCNDALSSANDRQYANTQPSYRHCVKCNTRDAAVTTSENTCEEEKPLQCVPYMTVVNINTCSHKQPHIEHVPIYQGTPCSFELDNLLGRSNNFCSRERDESTCSFGKERDGVYSRIPPLLSYQQQPRPFCEPPTTGLRAFTMVNRDKKENYCYCGKEMCCVCSQVSE